MGESAGQEPADTYPEKKSGDGPQPSAPAHAAEPDDVPRPPRITVVRSSKTHDNLPASSKPETPDPPSASNKPAAKIDLPHQAQSQSLARPAKTSHAAHVTPAPRVSQSSRPASLQDQTETVLNAAIKPLPPVAPLEEEFPGQDIDPDEDGTQRLPVSLSMSRQGLKPITSLDEADQPPAPRNRDTRELKNNTKFVLPAPDQPVPPPQAPPQFLGDQGHTRPSDSSLDRSQFGTASKHGGAPIALLTNVNRGKKKQAAAGKIDKILHFIKSNWIASILTLSMVLLAYLSLANKDSKSENVGNLDLSILTTGQSLEEVNQLVGAKKYETALAVCDNVIKKDSKFAEAYHARGQVYMAMHRFREAVDDFTTAESFNSRSVDIHIDRAAALYHVQDYDKAKREYEQILTAEPNNAAAFFGKGLAEENLGQPKEALADFQHTLENRSDYAAAYEEMGSIHFAKGDMKKSYEDYSNAIKIAPTISRFYFNRANALKQDHQVQRAIADYCKAIQLEPTRPEYFNNRGLLYLDNDDVAKAMTDFSSAVDLDPTYTIAKHNLTLAQDRLRR